MRVKIAGLIPYSVVDGPGICFVIFMQGCLHHCPGCHNPETHDFNGGKWMEIDDIIEKIKESHAKNVTLSGGDPLMQSREAYEIVFKLKQLGYNVNMYTGYTFEEICKSSDDNAKAAANIVDLLIDGRFDINKRTLDIPFVGSSNQRVLTIKDRVRMLKEFSGYEN